MFCFWFAFRYDDFMSRGKLFKNGVIMQDNEPFTISYLLDLGYDVRLIPRSLVKGVHSADIVL